MAELVWLLDLEVGGRVLKLSTKPVVVAGEYYEGGLDGVSLRESLSGVGRLPSEREAAISFAASVNVARFGQLQGRGRLFLWRGTGRGTLQLDGFLRSTEVGGQNEPSSATLAAEPFADIGSTHLPSERIDERTWPVFVNTSSRDGAGDWYPRIFGTPWANIHRGRLNFGNDVRIPVVEVQGGANPERVNKLLIGSVRSHVASGVSSVFAPADNTDESLGSGAVTPTIVNDGRGQSVWIVDLSSASALLRRRSDFFFAPNDGRSITRPRTIPRASLTVGEIMRDLASEATIPIDDGEWARVGEWFPYRAGFVVREPQSPMDLALDLMKDLPVSLYSTPRGLGIVRWPYDATRDDAVAKLVEGDNMSRSSGIKLLRDASEAAGRFIVEWAYSERSQAYRNFAAMTDDILDASDDPDQGSSVWTRTDDRKGEGFTEGEVQVISAFWLQDDAGAFEIARWKSAELAIGAREIDAEVRADVAVGLTLGSVVVVTAPELGLNEALGIVAGRELRDSNMWPVRLVLLSPVTSQKLFPVPGFNPPAFTDSDPNDPPQQ